MQRHLIMVAALGLIPLLAACGPATATPEVEATATSSVTVASPTASSPATPTTALTPTTGEVAQVTSTSEATFPTPNPDPECVAEPIPEDPNIPPPAADEWSKGPDDALVTLLEYSDFQ